MMRWQLAIEYVLILLYIGVQIFQRMIKLRLSASLVLFLRFIDSFSAIVWQIIVRRVLVGIIHPIHFISKPGGVHVIRISFRFILRLFNGNVLTCLII